MKRLIGGVAVAGAACGALLACMGGTDIHFNEAPEAGKIRVACVGDSLTNGALVPGCFWNSYPVQLGKLLGEGYQVANFGLNDRTLQMSGHKPYEKENDFGHSLEFKPHYVVVMLGTNDTKEMNWISVEAFAKEYRRFLSSYRALPTNPKIILCIPPWATDAKNAIQALTNDTVAARIPLVAEAVRIVANEYKLHVIDFYSLTEGKSWLYAHDDLHFNAKGAALAAEEVRKAIQSL